MPLILGVRPRAAAVRRLAYAALRCTHNASARVSRSSETERVRGFPIYAEDMSHDFTHEQDAGRYALRFGNQLVCVLDYRINRNAISLTRTYTQPPHRGNGYAAELVDYAVNDIASTTPYRIVPMCWYVGDWFEAHPERSGLLSR
jgi:uncharacterized protein